MAITLSPVISAQRAGHGPQFSARRVDPALFEGAADPVMGLDHYRMRGITFAPHPHAGFSAISYLFEDSAGGLRNRDSLGHDFVVEPGGILWTQAGSGVMHDELPDVVGKEVHGLQIFVNLSAANKDTKPEVHLLSAAEVPVWRSPASSELRVVVGDYKDLNSPLKPTEAFNLFDIGMIRADEIVLPLAEGWDMLVYSIEGTVVVTAGGSQSVLGSADAVSAVADVSAGEVRMNSETDGRLIILSGKALREPVLQHGPFIMNNQQQLVAAVERFRRGEMGDLQPLQ